MVKDSEEAMWVPARPEEYAHVKENQQVSLLGSRPLQDQCPRYPPTRRMLLGVTSPAIAPRIGAVLDAEEKMRKRSERMEPRFISCIVAAMHTFDFTLPDAWSRKKIKAPPSRKPGVSADVWNNVYTPADDWSRLKWPGERKEILLEVARECRGSIYLTVVELVPHGDDSVEFLVNDELLYHAGDLTVPARPDSGMDMRQGPSGPGLKPDAKGDNVMDQDDDPMEGKEDKTSGLDFGALERDLLEYQFKEDDDDDGEVVDEPLLLMMPSSFMSPTKDAAVSLSPADPVGLALSFRSKEGQKLLHESPRRRRIEDTILPRHIGRGGLGEILK